MQPVARRCRDARDVSQSVFEELVGAPAVADYLRRKMRTVRRYGISAPWARRAD
jgi:hypothetical protein